MKSLHCTVTLEGNFYRKKMQECRKTSNQIKLESIVASTLSAEEAQLPLSHGAVILSKAHNTDPH